jgi:hypothetical protein
VTASLPVERVVSLLVGAGYRRVDGSLLVGTIPFEFSATLVGGDHSLDMVVVIDTVTEGADTRFRKKVEGLSRALDLIGSRRTVSVVLVGPTPGSVTIQAMARVSRVLAVGTPTGDNADQSVRDALAVLLPLDLPDTSEKLAQPMVQLASALGDRYPDAAPMLIAAAAAGSEQVEATLKDFLDEVLPVDGGPLL